MSSQSRDPGTSETLDLPASSAEEARPFAGAQDMVRVSVLTHMASQTRACSRVPESHRLSVNQYES